MMYTLSPSANREARLLREIPPCFFLLAGIVGVCQTHYEFVEWKGYEMVTLARSLAEHGTFANPFHALATGPTAANPPLYPVLLTVIIKLFKSTALVHGAALLGTIMANAMTAAMLPYVSFLLLGDVISGSVASLLWLGAMQPIPVWDTCYTVAGLLAFVLLTASGMNKGKHLVASACLNGTLAGLLFLLNPSSILVILPWLVYLYAQSRAHIRDALKYSLVVIVAMCILPSLWVVRNHRELGAFVVRTNLGMTLYASNNDCAQTTLREELSSGCYKAYHPNLNANQAEILQRVGEVQYDRMRIEDARHWMSSHPRQFTRLTLSRIWVFWFPPNQIGSWYHSDFICIITAFSVPGLIFMLYRREPVTTFVLAVLLLYPLIYYVVVADIRYRFPVLWLSLLPAGYCMARLIYLCATKPQPHREQAAGCTLR